MTESQYAAWLRNPANRKYQTTLVVLYHSTGAVKLSTRGYISENHVPFHAWIVKGSSPTVEYRLGAPVGYGSFKAFNPQNNSWQNLQFRGNEAELYFGDIRWSFTDFQQIGACIIDDVTHEGNSVYSFSLSAAILNLTPKIA